MNMRQATLVTAGLVLGIGMSSYALAQTSEPSEPAGMTNSDSLRAATVFTVHGKIVEVDKSKSLVTLESQGQKVTLKVENPYNLEAAKVGEPIVVQYYEAVTVRKKKPGEDIPGISVKEGIVTAKRGGVPGAVADQQASVVLSVVEVDQANGILTVKGPDGSVEKVRARDPKNLRHLKPGDEIVVTVSRATAISLEKESRG
jgi:hypothetical protein